MTEIPDHNIITINHLVELIRHNAIEEFWNVLTDDDFTGELIPGSRRVSVDRIGLESARLPRDTAIVLDARDAAIALLDADPDLEAHAQLREEVEDLLGDAVEFLFKS